MLTAAIRRYGCPSFAPGRSWRAARPWRRLAGLGALLLLLLLLLSLPRGLAAQPSTRADSLLRLLARTAPDTNRVELLIQLAWDRTDDSPVAAIQYGRRSLALARQLGYPRGECRSLLMLGWAFLRAGDYPTAVQTQLEARRLAERVGFAGGIIHADNAIGYAFAEQGNYLAALRHYRRAIQLARQRQDSVLLTPILGNLGQAFQHLGQLDSAHYYTYQGYQCDLRQHDWHSEIGDLALLGDIEAARSDTTAARRYYQQSIRRAEGMPVSYALCRAYLGLAHLAEARHDPAHTLHLARQALRAGQRGYYPKGIFEASNYLARLSATRGDTAAAFRYLSTAAVTRDSLFNHRQLAQVQALAFGEQMRQREQAEQQLKSEARLRQNLLLALLGGLVLAVGLLYLWLSRRQLAREVAFAREREQLERLRHVAVLVAEENERRRIGSDLHDSLGQLLSATKLNLHALERQLQRDPATATEAHLQKLENALSMLNSSIVEVRSIAHNLVPSALIKRGLAQAVREFAVKLPTGDLPLRVEVEAYGLDEQLDATTEGVLFRIIQELVQNILKHAHATEVTIQLVQDAGELSIIVADNGVGFDPHALDREAGIGLRNVETRVNYLGGRVHVDAQPGRGTTITLEVPLQPLKVA